MSFIQITGFALMAVVLLVVIRRERPEVATVLSILVGGLILINLAGPVVGVVRFFQNLGQRSNLDLAYVSTILRIVAIAYLTEFCAHVCKDAREETVASKVELAGKILILVAAVPVFYAVLETLSGLLG
ncbi:MAG TPA: stage III sporulation protein AD [Clostridia bacterium]|nr:stage III sporulation protein AD [Clostridia bacterium]